MKNLRWYVVGLFVLGWALMSAQAIYARNGIAVAPSQLTITGTHGAVEKRTLLLRTTEPVTNLQIIALDLTRADGKSVLSANTIAVVLSANTMEADGLLTLPLTIDLKDAPSGEFQGELLVSYDGGTLAVPLTVRVKDFWAAPLAVLLVGVILSAGVSVYRTRGKPRNEVLVQVEEIRAQMKSDNKLTPQFQARIETWLGDFQKRISHISQYDPATRSEQDKNLLSSLGYSFLEIALVDVDAALQAERWKEARDALEQAELVLLRWRRGRMDWLEEFKYYAELEQRLQEINSDAPYVRTVERGLKDVARNAPNLEGPDKLGDQLYALAQQVDRYLQLLSNLDKLNNLRNRLSADQAEQWRLKILGLQRRLDSLKPENKMTYQALQADIQTAIEELTKAASQPSGLERAAKGVRAVDTAAPRLTPPAPSAHELPIEEKRLSDPQIRLKLFTWVSYAIAVALLAGAGFGELYVAKATFGANAWGDYFALLAWGFGSEATRAAVTEMIKGWGLMGGK